MTDKADNDALVEAASAMLIYHESGGHIGNADEVEANLRAALRIPQPECTSCHGLNTSCPEGCERDPLTGELLPAQPDETETLRAKVVRLNALIAEAPAVAEGYDRCAFPEVQGVVDTTKRDIAHRLRKHFKGTDHGEGVDNADTTKTD